MTPNQFFKRSLTAVVTRGVQVTVFLLVAAQSPLGFAEELELEDDQPKTLEDALFGGTVKLDLRLRAEIATQDTKDTSQAYTSRLRLGYGTKEYNGWTFYVEMEDIRAVDNDRYFDGVDGDIRQTTIADPEDTELNQGYAKYNWKDAATQFTIGRQRIILDDARFVGNVGWRQNEQTYDAVSTVSNLTEDITLRHSFIWDVNGIFGPDADMDFSSETHLLNLTINNVLSGKLTLFGYHVDLDGQGNAAALSTDTFGIRFAGKQPLEDGAFWNYVFSYARQVDAGDNASDYEVDYVLAEANFASGGGTIGVGYEMLGSDNHGTKSFSTPLATGHNFNGWADSFLTTPADGLQDAYVQAGLKLPGKASAKVVYHWFWTEHGGGDLGDELDIILKKPLSKKTTVLAKYARYNGVSGSGATAETGLDNDKFWLQLDYKF